LSGYAFFPFSSSFHPWHIYIYISFSSLLDLVCAQPCFHILLKFYLFASCNLFHPSCPDLFIRSRGSLSLCLIFLFDHDSLSLSDLFIRSRLSLWSFCSIRSFFFILMRCSLSVLQAGGLVINPGHFLISTVISHFPNKFDGTSTLIMVWIGRGWWEEWHGYILPQFLLTTSPEEAPCVGCRDYQFVLPDCFVCQANPPFRLSDPSFSVSDNGAQYLHVCAIILLALSNFIRWIHP